ncbi:MAG: von Willebrand factor type A domain-containing protein [Ruminiclostridium sp.]|nr:von Willebrand factor type A domain-containing protein [Ruminiclostridium sp.]
MKKLRSLSITAAVLAAATLMSTASYAEGFFPQLAEIVNNPEASQNTYVTPMTNSTASAKYKKFTAAKPKVTAVSDWYGRELVWNPVDNALLYYVYKKGSTGYSLCGKTSDTSFYTDEDGFYYVRAVTYNYNDKRVFSKRSDVVKMEYYYEYDYSTDDVDYAMPETVNSTAEYAEEDGGVYEEAGYWGDDEVWLDDSDHVYPEDALTGEEYSHYDVDGFKKAAQTPLSTFSTDVDTASYANIRRLATDGYYIPEDAVRIEEMLNYFDYNYKRPSKSSFNVTYEYSDCPWNKDARLLYMGIQAKDTATEPNNNYVFLIDVSGSMYSKDKLPLVQEALKKFANEMTSKDRISIVTYSGMEKVVVAGARGNMKNCISDLADSLIADGVTNGERGITMAYEIAAKYYMKNGNNRVIMATDGDLNVGITDKGSLSEFISEKRDTGVYLTILGFGTGNLKDDKLETLAKDGNGNYHYIDCAAEATKVLVDERRKTMITVADDVKIQVEFNPNIVDSYKLIGYDGRKLANEDFTDDKKDAADMGAGQSVTVMYEIIPAKSSSGSSLIYQTSGNNKTDICTVKINYKEPGKTKSSTASLALKAANYCKYSKTGIRFKFAACVAETAMALRGDEQYGSVSLESAAKRFSKLNAKELETIGYSDDFGALLEMLTNR